MRLLQVTTLLLAASAALPCRAADAAPDAAALAQQRYHEGTASLDRGDFEAARLALVEAYALDPQPKYLWNLALVEAKGSHPAEALAHFRKYLRLPGVTEDERRTASTWMAAAAARTGHIRVDTAPGVAITVDSGLSAGTTPLADPIDVVPGPHHLEATRDAQTASTTVDAHAGETVVWQLQWQSPPATASAAAGLAPATAAAAPTASGPAAASGTPASAGTGSGSLGSGAPPANGSGAPPSAAAPSSPSSPAGPAGAQPATPPAQGSPTSGGSAAPPTTPPTPSEALTPNGKPLPTTKWVVTISLVGAGLLAFAAAGAISAASSDQASKESVLGTETGVCPQPPMTPGCAALKSAADLSAIETNLALGFGIAGGALLVSGVVALVAWPSVHLHQSTGFLSPVVTAGGGGAQWVQPF